MTGPPKTGNHAGSAFPLEQERVQEISGVDCISGLPRKATVTSEEVRQALGDPLDAIVEAIKGTLENVGAELAAELMDTGVVLCGGGSLLRRFDRFIQEQTGLPARLDAEPLTTVARGLLICLEHFEKWRPALKSSDEDV